MQQVGVERQLSEVAVVAAAATGLLVSMVAELAVPAAQAALVEVSRSVVGW